MRLQFEEESRPQPNEYMPVKFDTEPKSKDSKFMKLYRLIAMLAML